MINVRKSEERGHAQFDWLDTRHTFSFGDYYDPQHMGFSVLRVINEDEIAPGKGFPAHSHRDMEIVTYILSGAIAHKDSLGNGSVIRPGDVQRMTAGTGIQHSEFNPLPDESTKLLQIWILPEQRNLTPSYEQKSFPRHGQDGRLSLVVSRDGREDSVKIHQDVSIYVARFESGQAVGHDLGSNRAAWVQVVSGDIEVDDASLKQGDGATIVGQPDFKIKGTSNSEILLFDLPLSL